MAEAATSSSKTFAEKQADRMKRLRELHTKRVNISKILKSREFMNV